MLRCNHKLPPVETTTLHTANNFVLSIMLTVDRVRTIVQYNKPMQEAVLNCSCRSGFYYGCVDSVDGHVKKVFSLNQFVSLSFSQASLYFASVFLFVFIACCGFGAHASRRQSRWPWVQAHITGDSKSRQILKIRLHYTHRKKLQG